MATKRQQREAERSAKVQKRADVYSFIAGDSKRARRMSEVEAFKCVPTELTSFNRATTIGGAPLSCIWLVHGPSMGGKTAFLIALIKAFQRVGGIPTFVDAELSADTKRWFPALGCDLDSVVYIGRTSEDEDVEPLTYEEVVDEVDGVLSRYRSGKKDGQVKKGTPLIVVVDSVSKMVPANLLKNLEKDGGKALKGGVGRTQALLNTAWLAELGTKVGDDNILFAIVAHEMEHDKEGSWTDWKVRGGASLIYDSMMQVRVTYAGQVKDLAADNAPMVGKRHRVKIMKNKHGPAFREATFYTATGEGLCPMGFDRVREVVHEGILRGTIEGPDVGKKGVLTMGSKLVWKGEKVDLKKLYSLPDVVESMARELDAGLLEKR